MRMCAGWDPARKLLVILTVLTFTSVSAVVWFGWRLTGQEAIVESQRAHDRLESSADRVVVALQRLLARMGDRLIDRNQPPVTRDETVLVFGEGRFWGRLLYQPWIPPDTAVPAGQFAGGEALEFQHDKLQEAVQSYRRDAANSDPGIRAAALLRVARVLRKQGDVQGSSSAYRELATVPGVRIAGVPADLLARHALLELRPSAAEAAKLQHELESAKWQLTAAQFDFYWAEAAKHSGRMKRPEALIAVAEAATLVWSDWMNRRPQNSVGSIRTYGTSFTVIGRTGANGESTVVLGRPSTLLETACPASELACALVDADGVVVAGRTLAARAAIRTAAEAQLPWNLYVRHAGPSGEASLVSRQWYLGAVVVAMVLFLLSGSYVIGRAIRREAEFTRLQSDFVSAVSHEFRSPLTSMRHLSELLALGRVPEGPLQQRYYETLVSESGRLQRLVETLLNFGKMDAGRMEYKRRVIDIGDLVRSVTAEFELQTTASGRRVELSASRVDCSVAADGEALSVVVRNLIDNALKYSPDQPAVWVDWSRSNGSVAIRVRDAGMGIPSSEQEAVFGKFVRGSAAKAGNVRGTGVGLAMVRHIVQAHGGEIQLQSEPGRGSTFSVVLPAANHNGTHSSS